MYLNQLTDLFATNWLRINTNGLDFVEWRGREHLLKTCQHQFELVIIERMYL